MLESLLELRSLALTNYCPCREVCAPRITSQSQIMLRATPYSYIIDNSSVSKSLLLAIHRVYTPIFFDF
jgi:hypothetical protein